METLTVIAKRASVRQFSQRPLPAEKVEMLVDAGRHAPTAKGIEPWEFVVVQDKERLAQIAQECENGRFIKDAAGCIIVLCKDTKYYLEDGCAATENILLAACDLGLASCWVAGDKKAYGEKLKRLLGVPAALKLVSMVALGYPKGEVVPHKKRSVKEVLHWENF